MSHLFNYKKYNKILISCLISSIYFSSGVLFEPSVLCKNKKIEETTKQRNELVKKKKQQEKDLKNNINNIKSETERKENIDSKISEVKSQIDIINLYISELNNKILELEKQIENTKLKIKEKVELLKEALVSIYVAGDTMAIDIVLGAKDFNDFLDKADIVRSVSGTIKELIDTLNECINELEAQQKQILELKEEQKLELKKAENQRAELQKLYEESEKLISEYEKSKEQIQKEIDENDSEIKALNSEIKKYYEEERRRIEEEKRKNKNYVEPKINKNGLVWPVPGYSKITSYFGETSNRSKAHNGLDIAGAGIYGAPVVAMAEGTVISVNTVVNSKGQGGGGYGKYVVIDHGGSTSTLYGHLSVVSVSKGQKVTRGQTIGNVGSTGFSTGPHLHFEVRENNIRKNPLNYVNY